jgi:hypothetical protein
LPLKPHAARDRQIIRLLALGFPAADLADLTGLGPRQLRRIGGPAPAEAPARPRDVHCTGAALDVLAGGRADRRRNGRPYRAG